MRTRARAAVRTCVSAKELVVAHTIRSLSPILAPLTTEPPRLPAECSRAAALLEEGRASEAMAVAHQGLRSYPRHPELLLLLGRSLLLLGDFNEARRALLEGTIVAPADARLCEWLARAMLGLGESYRAVRLLQRAVSLGANDDRVAELYARAHLAWEEKKLASREITRRPSSRPPAPTSSDTVDEAETWEALLAEAKGRG